MIRDVRTNPESSSLAGAHIRSRHRRSHPSVPARGSSSSEATELPRIPGIELSAIHRAAGYDFAGVDFFDVWPASDDSWDVLIGHTSSYGTRTSSVAQVVQRTARSAARTARRPSTILNAINDTIRALCRPCTACCVRIRIEPRGARLCLAVAGHPLPLAARATGNIERIGHQGTPLGGFAHPRVVDAVAALANGDALVLYSGGLVSHLAHYADGPTLEGVLAATVGRSATEMIAAVDDWILRSDDKHPNDSTAVILRSVNEGHRDELS